MRAARVGVAIGPERLWAVALDRRGRPRARDPVWSRALGPVEDGADQWPDLRAAFIEMSDALGVRPGRVYLALLPPLAQLRRLELPHLRPVELDRVLTRDAARYFLAARRPQVASGLPIDSARATAKRVLAAAADERLVREIFAAAAEGGWTVEWAVPAQWAWFAASSPALGNSTGWVIVAYGDTLQLLCIEDGKLSALRRLPIELSRPDELSDALDMVGGAPREGRCMVVTGPQERRADIIRALSDCGVELLEPEVGASIDSPAEVAARFAASAGGPALLPDPVRDQRRRRSNRSTLRLAAAAAAMLVVAAGLELWGARRELEAVRDRRAELRADVAAAMARRDELLAGQTRLAALDAARQTSPRWSELMGVVARHLPRDAHLTGFRAAGDSLVLEGLAGRAVGVFEELSGAPALLGVRAESPIRREQVGSEEAVERFRLAAKLTEPAGGAGTGGTR